MLQLAGGVAFGMDVGDLFQLERAFERDRVALAAAEIEHVARPRQRMGERLVGPLVSQQRRHVTGDFGQRLHELGFERLVDIAPRLAGGDGEAGKRGELAGEGLGRGDADLRTGERRDHGV